LPAAPLIDYEPRSYLEVPSRRPAAVPRWVRSESGCVSSPEHLTFYSPLATPPVNTNTKYKYKIYFFFNISSTGSRGSSTPGGEPAIFSWNGAVVAPEPTRGADRGVAESGATPRRPRNNVGIEALPPQLGSAVLATLTAAPVATGDAAVRTFRLQSHLQQFSSSQQSDRYMEPQERLVPMPLAAQIAAALGGFVGIHFAALTTQFWVLLPVAAQIQIQIQIQNILVTPKVPLHLGLPQRTSRICHLQQRTSEPTRTAQRPGL
jgi:hypothetical protein